MKEKEEYGFCPKCGALMKDGVCAACGEGKQEASAGGQEADSPGASGSPLGIDPRFGGEGSIGPDRYGAQSGCGAQNGSGAPFDGNTQSGYGAQNGSGTQNGSVSQPGCGPQSGYGPQGCGAQNGSGAPFDGNTQSGYGAQNGSGTQNGSVSQPGCGPQSGYGPQNGSGVQSGYDPQSGYGPRFGGSTQPGYGPQNGSVSQPGCGPQSGYGPQFGGSAQPGYGAQSMPGGGREPDRNRKHIQNGSVSQPGCGPQSGYGPQFGGSAQPGYGAQSMPGGGREPDRNRKHIMTAILVTVIAVLLCVVLVLAFLLARGAAQEAASVIGKAVPGGYEDILPPDYSGEEPFLYELPEESNPKEPYVPSAQDDYYVELADAVREDLSYQIEWEEYDYVDDKTGATAVGRYPRLVGGRIPHIDELNERIKEEATYYSELYAYYKEWQEGESLSYASESMGYVTYMDEERISIVFQERFVMDMESSISLYSINIDLMSGEILDNGSVIQYSQELAEAFRAQNDYQNGYVEAVDSMNDEELLDFLSDPDTNIVFFTPVGLEIGFNYSTSDSTGWVSATLKDYSRYTKKF